MDRDEALRGAGLRFQTSVAEETLALEPEDLEALRFLANAYAEMERHDEGLRMNLRIRTLLPRDARIRYNLACSFALCGKREEALRSLQEAQELGFDDLDLLRRDEDLSALRDDPRYQGVEAKIARKRG